MDSKKIEVKDSGKYGKAIFATEPIRAGEVICTLDGVFIKAERASLVPNDPPDMLQDHAVQVGEHLCATGQGWAATFLTRVVQTAWYKDSIPLWPCGTYSQAKNFLTTIPPQKTVTGF